MLLEEAIKDQSLAAAQAALRAGVDVNGRNADGFTPLMVAAGLGRVQMVELLLTADADPNIMEMRMGSTALHKAAQSGNPDVISLLLDHGAFVDHQSPVLGNTPLIDAVLHKQETAVRVLLAKGARTRIRNHWQQCALDLAREDGSDALVREIEAREATDAEQIAGLTLIAAVRAGDLAEAARLIAAGADLNQRLPITGSVIDDYTPLGLAVRERQTEMIRLLLDAGANPHGVIGLMRGTVVHEASFLGFADVLNALLSEQRQIGAPDPELNARGPYNGLTPLHDAVWHGHLDAVQVLLQAGASLSLRTHAGLTPRELALHYGYGKVAVTLAMAELARSN